MIEENKRRRRDEDEYELLDTGIFANDEYFDVVIEYAKAGTGDLLLEIAVHNRGPQAAKIHFLPQLWFRNAWTWTPGSLRPNLSAENDASILTHHSQLGDYLFECDGNPTLPFCDNETKTRRLYGKSSPNLYFKDGINDRVIHGKCEAVNPTRQGTKAAAHFILDVPAGGDSRVRARLSKLEETRPPYANTFSDFDGIMASRRQEADLFYARLQVGMESDDSRQVQRQALAGMIWAKQYYYFDVPEWIQGDPTTPPPPLARIHGRNPSTTDSLPARRQLHFPTPI